MFLPRASCEDNDGAVLLLSLSPGLKASVCEGAGPFADASEKLARAQKTIIDKVRPEASCPELC